MTVLTAAAVSVEEPQLLHIKENDKQYYGANQSWYGTQWQQKSGCGPTVASHLIWYLSRTQPDLETLCPYEGSTKEGFVELMEEVWRYVTPKAQGLSRTSLFAEGALCYAMEKGARLGCKTLDVSKNPYLRPKMNQVASFLADALSNNLLVAFLNLSNGALRNLESWHWVTLTSFDPQSGTACMYDQGVKEIIDLKKWRTTTLLGGGFAVIHT